MVTKKVRAKKVGVVENYFSHIGVAVINLTGTLSKGDKIVITNPSKTKDFKQTVTSMQVDMKPVLKAGKGKSIGLKTNHPVRKKYIVYKI